MTGTLRVKKVKVVSVTLKYAGLCVKELARNWVVYFMSRQYFIECKTMVYLMSKVLMHVLSKMPTVRNACSLVTSRELPSGLQIWGKRLLNALFSVGNNER